MATRKAPPVPSPEAPKAPAFEPGTWQRYGVRLQFRERVYGGIPKNPHIFDSWQQAKAFPPDLMQENVQDVAGELKVGLHLREFQMKACLKEATQRLGLYQRLKRNEDGMGLRSHFQTGVYVMPRNLYLLRDGKPITEPDGSDEAQGRVPTPKGPKSILRKSEYVERAMVECEIRLLPFKGFGRRELESVLVLAQEIGLGSWRAREEGSFDVLAFDALES